MDADVRKIIDEKDKKIEELQARVKELERKVRYYEIKEVYRDLLPEDFLQRLVELPPEMMVLELGKYLRGMTTEKVKPVVEKSYKEKEEIKAPEPKEVPIPKPAGVKAKVGLDLNFTQRYDYSGSDVAFLGEDLMKSLGASEGDYIVVQKESSVNLRVLPYTKPGFIVVPTWVREKIGAKINDFVEVIKR
ncbi:MAG: hypothetical protein NZ872_01310 [Archaeoglobaceae archaeon]|nr:hypothetical protein [Archaeoglobaceae archaeon]MDW8127836.1 hypothetical protein [Archaeoglobaceae archaeon]